MSSSSDTGNKRLRTSCNECHNAKSKCSGESPCRTCARLGLECIYGRSNRMGRPRGTKNKKTLARLNATDDSQPTAAQLDAAGHADGNDSNSSSNTIQAGLMCSIDDDYLSMLSGIPDVNSLDSDPFCRIDAFQFNYAGLGYGGADDDMSNFFMPHTEEFTTDWHKASHRASMFGGSVSNSLSDASMLTAESTAATMYSPSSAASSAQSSSQYFSSAMPSGSNSAGANSEHSQCRCLRNQTELFCTLNEFKKCCGATQVGLILEKAPIALAHWKNALHCPHCESVQDRDVYNMIAMGIRVMLGIIESSCTSGAARELTDYTNKTSRRASSAAATPPTPRMQFGLYEVTGEDYALVAHTLLVRNIQRIRAIMTRLRSCVDATYSAGGGGGLQSTDSSRRSSTACPPIDDIEHLPQLARSLDDRAEALLQHINTGRM